MTNTYYYNEDDYYFFEFDDLINDEADNWKQRHVASDMFKKNYMTATQLKDFMKDDNGFNPIKQFGDKYGKIIINEVQKAAKPIFTKELNIYNKLDEDGKELYDVSQYNETINKMIIKIYNKYEDIITTESKIVPFIKNLSKEQKIKVYELLHDSEFFERFSYDIWNTLITEYNYKNPANVYENHEYYGEYDVKLLEKIHIILKSEIQQGGSKSLCMGYKLNGTKCNNIAKLPISNPKYCKLSGHNRTIHNGGCSCGKTIF